jgi:hypothetical protein
MNEELIKKIEDRINEVCNLNDPKWSADTMAQWVEPLEWVLSELKKEDEKCCSNCIKDKHCSNYIIKYGKFETKVNITYCSNYKEVVK